MAELIKRLYGPSVLAPNAETTLLTVPTRTLDIVRGIQVTCPPGESATASALSLAIGATTNATKVFQESISPGASRFFPRSIPVAEAETLRTYTSAINTPVYTTLVSSNNTTDATSFATAGAVLPADRLIIACVVNTKATTPDVVSSITHGGTSAPTFSQLATAANTAGSLGVRSSIWAAVQGSSATSNAALTIDFGSGNTQTGALWHVFEFRYAILDPVLANTNYQTITATGTTEATHTATFGSAMTSASNFAVSCIGQTNTSAGINWTAETGWTERVDQNISTPAASQHTMTRIGTSDTTPTGTPSATANTPAWAMTAVEFTVAGLLTLTLTGVEIT